MKYQNISLDSSQLGGKHHLLRRQINSDTHTQTLTQSYLPDRRRAFARSVIDSDYELSTPHTAPTFSSGALIVVEKDSHSWDSSDCV